MSLVLIHGQKAIFCAAVCERCVRACPWCCVRCSVTRGRRKPWQQLTTSSLSGESHAGTFPCLPRTRAISHLWQVSVPWHRLVPGAQSPEASPRSSTPVGFARSAIQPRLFCKDKWAPARGTAVRVTFLVSWLVHRESSLL